VIDELRRRDLLEHVDPRPRHVVDADGRPSTPPVVVDRPSRQTPREK